MHAGMHAWAVNRMQTLFLQTPACTYLAIGVNDLPAGHRWMVADLLAEHLHSIGILGLEGLTQDWVEWFVERHLPAEATNSKSYYPLHAGHRIVRVGGLDQKIQVVPVRGYPLQKAARLK
eukprot:364265-Chlamydomonas_euryale.AAC.7